MWLCMLSEVLGAAGDSLHQAQLNKLDAMIRTAGITAADHVLEIGCGWGSMAIRAAQTTGCRWTGITVSKEQLAEATARVDAAGLTDRITLLFCDYRFGCLSLRSLLAVVLVTIQQAVPIPRETSVWR